MSHPKTFEVVVLDDDGHTLQTVVAESDQAPSIRVMIGKARSYLNLLPGQSITVREVPDPKLRTTKR